MGNQQVLQAEKRDVKGTTASKRLRREGIVPGVVYGSSQREYMIQLDSKKFFDVAKAQSSANFIVNLEIEGAEEKSKLAIVQDIQRDPLTGNLIHVDFRAVSENETINAVIPISLTGEAHGVKEGGLLEHLLHSIEVFCRPADLPERISYDVEHLEIGEPVKVSDLTFPEGVTYQMGDEVLVAIINKSRAAVSEGGGAAGEGEEGAAEGEGEEGAEASSDGESSDS